MKSKILAIIGLAILFTYGCSPTAVRTKSGTSQVDEDLSVHRKAYLDSREVASVATSNKVEIKDIPDSYEDIAPSNDLSKEMDSILQIKKAVKADIDKIKGFTIQVFSGKDRSKAFYARDKVYSTLDGKSPSIKYYQPNYQVKVGEYFTELDALEDFSVLKESFPNALIIPIKISVNRIK